MTSVRLTPFGACVCTLLASACVTGAPRTLPLDASARLAITNERSIDASTFPARSLAVVPLNVSVRDTSLAVLGVGLADLLIVDLAQSRQLLLVERIRLDAIFRELKLAASGRVDSVTAPRVGRLVGARRIVVGDIEELPDGQLRISTRIADASTSTVTTGVDNTSKVAQVLDAQKALAFALFDALGVTLTPSERARVELRPTRNLAALLAYSRGVRDDAIGDYGAAAANFRAALRIDPGFSQSRARATEAEARAFDAGQVSSTSPAGRLAGIGGLADQSINRPSSVTQTSDAAGPSFSAALRNTTIIVTVQIP